MSDQQTTESEQPDKRYKAGGPDALTLTVCQSCTRTDRWNKLTDRHYAQGGGWCPGPIERVTYVRYPPADPYRGLGVGGDGGGY